MADIKFGTSGWRDIIGDNFTFDNVKIVTQAICDYINQEVQDKEKKVIVGYDTRFLSEEFAKISCEVLAGNNIKSLYCKRDTPTPVISYYIVSNGYSGGINFTASHNPPEYNGLKFSPSWGGPALPEQTNKIEKRIKELNIQMVKRMPYDEGIKNGLITEIDTRKEYIERIKQLVDLKTIKKAKLKVGIDLLYGTGRDYLDKVLLQICSKAVIIHDYRDVLFGGRRPEPDEEGLKELKTIIKKQRLHTGVATDGDADRFGILDRDGTYITPNQVIALLLYYFAERRKWKGIVARSVMTTHLIDAIAKKYNIEVKETPVGFKYIGDIMVSNKNDFIIGGEESGGLSIRNHVPEKDGILACLLMCELVAVEKKSIKEILKTIMKDVGVYITKRINVRATPEIISTLKEKLKENPPQDISGLKVNNVVTMDGYKFILEDNSWVGMRISGTEPVVRLYVETNSSKKLEQLISGSKKIIGI